MRMKKLYGMCGHHCCHAWTFIKFAPRRISSFASKLGLYYCVTPGITLRGIRFSLDVNGQLAVRRAITSCPSGLRSAFHISPPSAVTSTQVVRITALAVYATSNAIFERKLSTGVHTAFFNVRAKRALTNTTVTTYRKTQFIHMHTPWRAY